jgi:hypothetical protein
VLSWGFLIIAIQILSCCLNALPAIYVADSGVYGFSACCVLESTKTAKTLHIYPDFQSVKLSNYNTRQGFCHSVKYANKSVIADFTLKN